MRALRAAAWGVFSLDLVILAQFGYQMLAQHGGGPAAQAVLRDFALMLGSGLFGVGVVLVASSWSHSKAGLWVSLVCGALPLVWVASAMLRIAGD